MNRYRHISPAERAEIWRHVKSRSRIENGVITVHFVKILPEPAPTQPTIEQQRDAELDRAYNERLINSLTYEQIKKQIAKDNRLGICQECGKVCVPGFLYHSECFVPDPNPPNYKCVVGECTRDAVDGEAFCTAHMLYLGPERPEQWECTDDHLCRCPRCRPQPPDAPEPEGWREQVKELKQDPAVRQALYDEQDDGDCEDCGEPVYRDGLCLECYNIALSNEGA